MAKIGLHEHPDAMSLERSALQPVMRRLLLCSALSIAACHGGASAPAPAPELGQSHAPPPAATTTP
ncbi:MAG TPA: hypothetical protein VFP84_35510, partial [Kofleriaceae bacterium]|nr:hypothetical protein [Kofleriaceae bacterium]